MFVQFNGSDLCVVEEFVGLWRQIDGLRVDRRFLHREGSDGIGAVQPGDPGRITRMVHLCIPGLSPILVWDYSSGGERDIRPVVSISTKDFSAVKDIPEMERKIAEIQRRALAEIEELRYAANPMTVEETGRVLA